MNVEIIRLNLPLGDIGCTFHLNRRNEMLPFVRPIGQFQMSAGIRVRGRRDVAVSGGHGSGTTRIDEEI